MIRSDLYAQAQGIRHPDRQSCTGYLWYRTDVELTAGQADGAPHIRFPGLFNECWLYINGKEVAFRKQGKLWWLNDYRFKWDVDLSGKLKAGRNIIALRCNCEHHFGGMFRVPAAVFVPRCEPVDPELIPASRRPPATLESFHRDLAGSAWGAIRPSALPDGSR